jgi:hypothetical protein
MPNLIEYFGNATTSVVRQGKYRISMKSGKPVIEVVIETSDDMRIYPASSSHPRLVSMVNAVKQAAGYGSGGQFYINEYQQVIVPATDSLGDGYVRYYYAGDYDGEIELCLDGDKFSGKPLRSDGSLMQPGESWEGRPRPGIGYKLKAGAQDIEFSVQISQGREKIYRLSKVAGVLAAKKVAALVAQVKGIKGGKFYINEYRAMFCPLNEGDLTDWKYVGTLDVKDPWFPRWEPAELINTTPSINPSEHITQLSEKRGFSVIPNKITGSKKSIESSNSNIRENDSSFRIEDYLT